VQLLEMGLSTEEKVFIVEYYFRSYGSGRQTTRPDVMVQTPLHSTRVTIWCAVSAHGILGPYFIEDEEGNALTVTWTISSGFEKVLSCKGPSHQ
jgi:hypothetical protein